ncbi:uncharacterized protein LOC122458131 [Dermochelys coriacea]|uniref:uncharacterized protein LOC122458131 n=1 Tax=Dermochelys coriacea TaxID=27794 RepID=UPI001CA7BD35|nr:uncharacterized protein LOC122458131 [Dermochelys coriacea]
MAPGNTPQGGQLEKPQSAVWPQQLAPASQSSCGPHHPAAGASLGIVKGQGPVIEGHCDIQHDDLLPVLIGDDDVQSQLSVGSGDAPSRPLPCLPPLAEPQGAAPPVPALRTVPGQLCSACRFEQRGQAVGPRAPVGHAASIHAALSSLREVESYIGRDIAGNKEIWRILETIMLPGIKINLLSFHHNTCCSSLQAGHGRTS